MLHIERRIAALEAQRTDKGMKVVYVHDDEIEADALRRVGLPADIRDRACVVFLSELDERL